MNLFLLLLACIIGGVSLYVVARSGLRRRFVIFTLEEFRSHCDLHREYIAHCWAQQREVEAKLAGMRRSLCGALKRFYQLKSAYKRLEHLAFCVHPQQLNALQLENLKLSSYVIALTAELERRGVTAVEPEPQPQPQPTHLTPAVL